MSIRPWLLSILLSSLLLPTLAACGGSEESPEAETAAEDQGESMEAAMGGTAPGEAGPILSGNNRFELRYVADTDPILVNTMHGWVVNLRTLDGEPIENARLTIDGDMPEHGHGLPTTPEVTEELGGGDYRIEGMKFQMDGYWEVYIDVFTAEGEADSVIVPIQFR